MSTKLLIIDDDTDANSMLADYLEGYGFELLTASRPKIGMELLRSEHPKLLILDVMLPEKNGFEVCQEIRQESKLPIIMLTARGDVNDRIVGLELGADDYMPKPYEPRELVARIQSVLRRAEEMPAHGKQMVKSKDLVVDLVRRSGTLAGTALELTTMEFDVLSLFMRNPGIILSRDEISDQLKGVEWNAYDRTIDVIVSRLRQKLADDPKSPRYLKTVWGSGYIFLGEVSYAEAVQ